MTGIDTNVVVRYIVQDDPIQSSAANQLFDSLTADSPGFISATVLVELVWVLQSCYSAHQQEVERVLETLLRSRELMIENADLIWQSLRRFRLATADFADCLIECSGHAAGCKHTVTFDHNAAKNAGMKLL
jgi:predicted nucleic-acid-binding protein